MSVNISSSALKNREICPDIRGSVRVVVPGVPKPLWYSVPDDLESIDLGWEVLVEVGSRKVRGWVVEKQHGVDFLQGIKTAADSRLHKAAKSNSKNSNLQLSFSPILAPLEDLKTIAPNIKTPQLKAVLSGCYAFPPSQLVLFTWMSEYYGASLVEIIASAVPKRSVPKRVISKKTVGKQKHEVSAEPEVKKDFLENTQPPLLTSDQSKALKDVLDAIDSKQFSSLLLFGATGSGKTEVYLQAIEHVLHHGGSALVLVPEIALTPQVIDQFQARLALPLALLHSQVGEAQRVRSWDAILRGDIRVVIGARSAVFAPLQNLRLIIVDEEHENSYKQSDNLRYHARDVAVMRAKFSNCTVILGSATPSFESLLNVQKRKYQLLEMPNRVTTRPAPALEIVELNKIKRAEMPSENVSPQLFAALKETLEKKGQVIILYNRRGFSNYLQCETCTEAVRCPNCAVTLTFHKHSDCLLCHYCSFQMPAPDYCDYCRNPRTSVVLSEGETGKKTNEVGLLTHRGAGTERMVEEIAHLFPTATIGRLDRDMVTKRDAYRRILGAMRSRETDILIGTQMIAKGHDLPGVTLVGIINTDVGLHMPDFRSSEKVYQLIIQAAGRAGRGQDSGRVIVQTREPEHPTIVASATGRFLAFARYELDYRKELSYPPWSRMLRVIVSSSNSQEVEQAARLVQETISRWAQSAAIVAEGHNPPDAAGKSRDITLLGPAPAPHQKLRNRYRWHLLIKATSAKLISELAAFLSQWKKSVKQFEDFRLNIDVDPVDMM